VALKLTIRDWRTKKTTRPQGNVTVKALCLTQIQTNLAEREEKRNLNSKQLTIKKQGEKISRGC